MRPLLPVVVEQVRPEVTYELRARVLRPGMPPMQVGFRGDHDSTAFHLAAYDRADRIVGVVAVVPEPMPPDDLPGCRLRGMAVHPDERGAGVGRTLLDRVFDGVARLGGGLLWCNARLPAAGFYRRGGFIEVSEPWEDPELGPHVRMRRTVTADDLIRAPDPDAE